MSIPSITTTAQIPVMPETALLRMTAVQRLLPVDLADKLQESSLTDKLTVSIRRIHADITSNLALLEPTNSASATQQVETFCTLLRRVLKDPMTGAPLDENSCLGNDGITYSGTTLEMHRHVVEDPYKYKSPLYPNKEDSFSTQIHPIVRSLVKWLKGRDSTFAQELDQSSSLTGTSYLQKVRLRALLARQQALSLQQATLRQAQETQTIERERVALQAVLSPIERQMQEEFAQIQRANTASIQIANERASRVNTEVTRTENDFRALQGRLSVLRETRDAIGISITAVDQRTTIVEGKTKALEDKIKEDEKDTLMDVLKCVAAIGACFVAGWAAPKLLATLGLTGGTVTVGTAKGGATVGLNFALPPI